MTDFSLMTHAGLFQSFGLHKTHLFLKINAQGRIQICRHPINN